MATSEALDTGCSNPLALAFAVAALQSGGTFVGSKKLSGLSPNSSTHTSENHSNSPMTYQPTPESRTDSRFCLRLKALSKPKHRVEEAEVDPELKLARNRERNREHARKTRLRKKAQLEALQSKAKGLEAERQVLKQQVEECSIASILLGLSSGCEQVHAVQTFLTTPSAQTANTVQSSDVSLMTSGSRKRFVLESSGEKKSQPLKLSIDGEVTLIGGGKSHVNWKSGSYVDEDGNQKRLSLEQLEHLRRERNRMHAKMTRDRKKCFISKIENTIEELESDICGMKSILAKVSHSKQLQLVTPATSPELAPAPSPSFDHDDESSVYSTAEHDCAMERPSKRIRHGFSLND